MSWIPTLDEARRIVRQRDTSDPARAILAAAAVLRWEANYTGDDAALGPLADHLEATADAMAAAGVGVDHHQTFLQDSPMIGDDTTGHE